MDCKYCQGDEVCVNADCPMCCDFCPVPDIPGVCRFEERGLKNEWIKNARVDLQDVQTLSAKSARR